MQKKKILIALGVILLLTIIATLWWWQRDRNAAPTYREATTTRGRIELAVQSTGTVRPRNRIEIKPPLAGRAEEVVVREGQSVKKGQVLLWMSSSERAALIDAARARGPEEVKRWEEFYRATPVVAPIAGTVIQRTVEPGQSFAATDPLLVIADRLLVEAQVDETDIAKIRVQLPARIQLDAYPEDIVAATVSAVAYEAKTVNNVTTYTVDVLPTKVPPAMRSGMTATVSFVLATKENVLQIPSHALRDKDGQKAVLVPDAKDAPREQAVEIGLSDGRQTEILSGLVEGDKLLVPQVRRDNKASPRSPLSPGGRPREKR